jgi:peptide/nickel transport system permease protein
VGAGLAHALTGSAARLLRTAAARGAGLLLLLVVTSVLVQVLVGLAPGDAVDLAGVAPDQRDALAAAWGLDQPPLTRALAAVGRAARGDLGTSLIVRPGAPVTELAGTAWLRSLPLLLGAVVLGPVLGVALALLGRGVGRLPGLALSGPRFVLVLLLVHGLNELTFGAMGAGWLSRPTWFPLPDVASALRGGLAVGLLAWGSGALADLQGQSAAALWRLREESWVLACESRGERSTPVLLRGLLPGLLAQSSAQVVAAAGGLVIIEKLLLLRGAGALLWDAALARDLPLVAGLTLGAATIVGVLRWILDVGRLRADPRLLDAS